jgi:hypothetical protein
MGHWRSDVSSELAVLESPLLTYNLTLTGQVSQLHLESPDRGGFAARLRGVSLCFWFSA